jgi:hypothetical protein
VVGWHSPHDTLPNHRVIPAKAGISVTGYPPSRGERLQTEIPAFAGMTPWTRMRP